MIHTYTYSIMDMHGQGSRYSWFPHCGSHPLLQRHELCTQHLTQIPEKRSSQVWRGGTGGDESVAPRFRAPRGSRRAPNHRARSGVPESQVTSRKSRLGLGRAQMRPPPESEGLLPTPCICQSPATPRPVSRVTACRTTGWSECTASRRPSGPGWR